MSEPLEADLASQYTIQGHGPLFVSFLTTPRGQAGVNNTLNYPPVQTRAETQAAERKVGRECSENAEQLSAVTFTCCKAMWNDITLTSQASDVPQGDCKEEEKMPSLINRPVEYSVCLQQ